MYSWYDTQTGRALAQEAIDQSKEKRIAFVSTPAAYRSFLTLQEESESSIDGENVYLFEYDRRFGDKYNEHFVFYDYNEPTKLPENFHRFFDYVLVDPPYLVRGSYDAIERKWIYHCERVVSMCRISTA